ncbi:MAG: hypothetical protein BGP12_06875 [Rhodospirillales bacterium 70-18]|nr:MAG: hypothetical protein BGP12_06875 [Rhodospirillales bacterium 70-18]
MEFLGRIKPGGGLDFGERNSVIFKRYLVENPGIVLRITPVLPESAKQRRYLEGAVIPLITYYQDGMDHHSADDRQRVREWLKQEFNSETVIIGGEVRRVPKSTKGRDALQPFLERVMDWLTENYQPPAEALDPKGFKVWQDTVFPNGGPDSYIDWLRETRALR